MFSKFFFLAIDNGNETNKSITVQLVSLHPDLQLHLLPHRKRPLTHGWHPVAQSP